MREFTKEEIEAVEAIVRLAKDGSLCGEKFEDCKCGFVELLIRVNEVLSKMRKAHD